MSGNLTNAGKILAGDTAVDVRTDTFNGSIVNSAGAIISARDAGIGIFRDAVSGGVTNAGSISARSGIAIEAGTFFGDVSNTGTISGGRGGISVEDTGTFAGAVVNASGGKISAGEGIFLNSVGVFGSGVASGGIVNAGTISAGFTGIGVYSIGTFSGGIDNASGGSIVVSSGGGIVVQYSSTFAGGITNAGTISSAEWYRLYGVSIFADGIDQHWQDCRCWRVRHRP